VSGQVGKINFMMHNWIILIQMDHEGLLGSDFKWGTFMLACACPDSYCGFWFTLLWGVCLDVVVHACMPLRRRLSVANPICTPKDMDHTRKSKCQQ
jgi:hypothetical protein